ncbi:hypothetical protein [Pseudanabaena sp. UWO310]|uniref:hypothetical protein n=1 Tax=Pseudanabaena sp. UWO310 TaxID=2480795 RepID=UPI0011602E23|nr:hypothetical protein [Pseudanabaena sp. UWO310]TYQ24529.1 hypothetical protein PseudUWO310_20650 [Pseudanabaena sp. UWO310]
MKKIFYGIAAIALSFSSNFVAVKSAQALEAGSYWGGGSRYISIFKQMNPTGDRYCYSGSSSNGTMITSLHLKIPRYLTGIDYEVYKLHEADDLSIQQYAFQPDQIIFGDLVGGFVRGLVYKRERDVDTERSPELQECLNSTQPYSKKILSGRDRR